MPVYKRSRVIGKRAATFASRLAELRKFTSEFDSDKFERAWNSRPKSERGKKQKRAALDKVRRTYQKLRFYIHRPHKVVKPRRSRNLNALREAVGMSRFRGLKAIPVPTDRAGTLKVSFDRKGRVKMKDGHATHKVFLFPHKPRNHYKRGRVVLSVTDDALAMTKSMLKKMPRGQYVLLTAHHFLMPTMEDREELPGMIQRFMAQYKETDFLRMLRGFKWISGSYEKAQQVKEFMQTERGREKLARKRVESERKARIIASMDRQIKSGKLPKLSARARATGRR